MKVIVGLGNPGPAHARTRHNLGFWVVDRVAASHGLSFSEHCYQSHAARGSIGGEPVLLLKPQTWMNLSGEAVGSAARDLGLDPGDFLVICDDVDLPPGRIRIRDAGGSGGHRGVASVIEGLGGTGFPRVRIGVGRPGSGPVPANYVLDGAVGEEAECLLEATARAAQAVEVWLGEGVIAAMNRFNVR